MKKYYLLFILLILNTSSIIADIKEKIDETVANYLSSRFLNASFIFADEEKDIIVGAKGLFALNGEQLKPNQKMPIASGTKSITAAGILKLQEKGLLNVKDKIIKHLGNNSAIWKKKRIPQWASQIIIHQLLTHTSGIIEYLPTLKIDPTMAHTDINKEIIDFAAGKPLEFKPGTKYKYSNTNYVILGLIIEEISKKSLADFFKDEFFDPLGMKASHLASFEEALQLQNNPEPTPYPARFFVIPNNTIKPEFKSAKVDFILVPFADGGVISTPRDLITWHRALHQGKSLSDKSYKLMTTKYIETPAKGGHKTYSGYGVFIADLENSDSFIYHSGSAVAIRSEAGYVPSKNLYFAILSNIMVHIPEEMKDKIDPNRIENQLDIIYFREAILKSISQSVE